MVRYLLSIIGNASFLILWLALLYFLFLATP